MKNIKKLALFILISAMIFTLPISAFAEEMSTSDGTSVEEWLEELRPENGNLAYGKDVYTNWTHIEDESWGYAKLTDGSFNPTSDGYGGWHGGDANINRRCWAAIDLGSSMSFDTVVLYPTTEGVPNAIRIIVTDDDSIFASAEDPGKIDAMPDGQIVYEACDIEDRSFSPYVCQFEEVSARFVIVYGLSLNAPWLSMQLSEVAVYNKGYTPPVEGRKNIALDSIASSNYSHNDSTWGIEKINDGDRYNIVLNNSSDHGQFAGYHSGLDTPHDGSTDVFVEFELASLEKISQVVIYPGSTKWTVAVQSGNEADRIFLSSDFNIEVSTDGNDWQNVYSETGFTLDEYAPVICDFDAVEASYVRVVFKSVTDHIKISEIEIYGESGPMTDEGTLSAADELFAAYMQTRPASEGTHDMRIVLVASYDKIAAMETSFTIKVTFILEDGGTAYYTAKLGGSSSDYTLYRRVTAGDDEYIAADGYALFGNVVTDIPDGAYNEVRAEITDDSDGEIVFTGRN